MSRQRIDAQPAFVLHTHPFSETSLIADIFSRDHGRLPLLARGARRPRSAVRGLLMAFQPLELGWFGGGEVKTLAKVEWSGGMPLLAGRCLLLGYYLNELLVRLLPREDAHPQLFDTYRAALAALARGAADAPELRRFEKNLLRELGYGLALEFDADSGEAVSASGDYVYHLEKGPVRQATKLGAGEAAQESELADLVLCGKTLLDMAADDYEDPRTRQESKRLMRRLLAHYLGGQPLQARRVFMELQEM